MKKSAIILSIILVFSVLSCKTQTEESTQQGSQPEQASQDDRNARMEKALAEVKYDVPDEIDIDYDVLDNIDTSTSTLGVVPLPKELGKTLNGLFAKDQKAVESPTTVVSSTPCQKTVDLHRYALSAHARNVDLLEPVNEGLEPHPTTFHLDNFLDEPSIPSCKQLVLSSPHVRIANDA